MVNTYPQYSCTCTRTLCMHITIAWCTYIVHINVTRYLYALFVRIFHAVLKQKRRAQNALSIRVTGLTNPRPRSTVHGTCQLHVNKINIIPDDGTVVCATLSKTSAAGRAGAAVRENSIFVFSRAYIGLQNEKSDAVPPDTLKQKSKKSCSKTS